VVVLNQLSGDTELLHGAESVALEEETAFVSVDLRLDQHRP
jgi:hypothetical protein